MTSDELRERIVKAIGAALIWDRTHGCTPITDVLMVDLELAAVAGAAAVMTVLERSPGYSEVAD